MDVEQSHTLYGMLQAGVRLGRRGVRSSMWQCMKSGVRMVMACGRRLCTRVVSVGSGLWEWGGESNIDSVLHV